MHEDAPALKRVMKIPVERRQAVLDYKSPDVSNGLKYAVVQIHTRAFVPE